MNKFKDEIIDAMMMYADLCEKFKNEGNHSAASECQFHINRLQSSYILADKEIIFYLGEKRIVITKSEYYNQKKSGGI